MSVLQQKLKKCLELRTDSPAMLDALESMSVFWDANTLEARRGLRQQLENQNIQLAEDFIASFSPLQERIGKVETEVLNLEESCGQVAHRLREAETAMCQFTERASVLTDRKLSLESQASAVEIFLSRYSLSESELFALKNAPLDSQHVPNVGDENKTNAVQFFEALDRLIKVREECCRLVGSKHQSAAFELLEVLSQQQESAYERIYHWVHDRMSLMESCVEAPGVGGESMMETYMCDPVLSLALKSLRARPEFLAHCAESLGSIRRSWLLRRFVMALTVGTGRGERRPMELAAHDAARYVSDMLAWVHEAIASEKDFLTHLFRKNENDDDTVDDGEADKNTVNDKSGLLEVKADDVSQTMDDDGLDDGGAITKNFQLANASEMLCHVVEGVARPLQVRLRGVIEAQLREGSDGVHQRGSALVVTFKLQNLLAFYRLTLFKLLHGREETTSIEPTAIELVLTECTGLSKKAFLELLELYSGSISRTPTAFPIDLSATGLMDHIKRLTEILSVDADSFLGSTEWVELNKLQSIAEKENRDDSYNKLAQVDMDLVLTSFLEPLLSLCRTSADGKLDQTDTAILMINNASAMKTAIETFTSNNSVEKWVSLLSSEVATWVSVLVKHEASVVLEASGLSDLLKMMEAMSSQGVASEFPGLDVESVGVVMRKFYASLFQIAMPTLDRLIPVDERTEARRAISLIIANSHASVHALVSDPKNGYSDTSFLLHSPAQVRMLLDC